MIFKIINFLIFAGVLVLLTKKPLVKFLNDREKTANNEVLAAKQAMEKAVSGDLEVSEKLKNVESEIKNLKDKISVKIKTERETALKTARLYADKLKKDLSDSARYETIKAKREISRQVLSTAVSAASARIKEEFSESEQKAMFKKELSSLEQMI